MWIAMIEAFCFKALDHIENQELYHVLITVDRLKEKVKKIFE